jgi:hypothetical protein
VSGAFFILVWRLTQRRYTAFASRKMDCAHVCLARLVAKQLKETKQWQHELDWQYGKAH